MGDELYGRVRTGDGTLEPIIQTESTPDGTILDEFVLTDCTIHLEAMDDTEYWIGVSKGDRMWHINLGAVNPHAKFYAHVEEDR